ncbi:MAG: hypothetical protein WEA29_04275 [Acidimicrobiia bacterium]
MSEPIPRRPLPGAARRTARAAMLRVDASFSRNGPAFKQLALSWSANAAGDTLVALALASTLFFGVPSSEARASVALYLGLTIAPFAIVAPVLGGVFSRFPGVYRATMTLSASLRSVVAVVMMMGLTTLWLFPLAFAMLVFSRLFGIGKASLLPVALAQPIALVSANAFLARVAIYSGALILPIGAAVVRIDPALGLLLAAFFFGLSAYLSLGLPNPRRPDVAEGEALDDLFPATPPRSLRLSRLATAVVRLLNGFLILLLAFAFRDAEAGLLDFGALIAAAGLGYGLASALSPLLERFLHEEPMVVAALAIEAAAAFIAGQFFGLPAAAALAGAAGLAWGTAKFAFDGLLQAKVHPDRRGAAFTRSETLFQLAWVIGAIIPVTVTISASVGLAVAGVIALAAQTVFVASLLVERR